ncbi:hypothetical protein IWW36_000462 [Coemansia brasiliensis]|uniref:Male-enhanced antigen 1 n=1 Tax=Coemansia brasiliensis TaxID=2650707 RepID=A0A9W8IB88_9FUNG|nr:hypothetical protein IWW36_000462 [Coemansia brasiliensis]
MEDQTVNTFAHSPEHRSSQSTNGTDSSCSESGIDDLFVAEVGYEQLDDEDSDENQLEIAADLERTIDERLFSDLEAKHKSCEADKQHTHTNVASSAEAYPAATTVMPLQVDIAESGSQMSPKHIDQIKSIMANVHLSDKAIPEWAKRVPEHAWMPKRKKDPDPSV